MRRLAAQVISTRSIVSRIPYCGSRAFSTPSPQLKAPGRPEQPEEPESKYSSPIGWKSVGAVIVIGSFTLWYYNRERQKRITDVRTRIRTAGKAILGGDFDLVDDEGKPFSASDLDGKFALLYFGFTFCPDVCPTELRKLDAILEQLKGVGLDQEVQPVFISIDPKRDSPERLHQYKKGPFFNAASLRLDLSL